MENNPSGNLAFVDKRKERKKEKERKEKQKNSRYHFVSTIAISNIYDRSSTGDTYPLPRTYTITTTTIANHQLAISAAAIKNENITRINARQAARGYALRYLIRSIELEPTKTSFSVSGGSVSPLRGTREIERERESGEQGTRLVSRQLA